MTRQLIYNPISNRLDYIDSVIPGLNYLGDWDASLNSPFLADGVGVQGSFYDVSVGGTQNLGSGNITFNVGDSVIYNGSIWIKRVSVEVAAGNNEEVQYNSGGVLAASNQFIWNIGSNRLELGNGTTGNLKVGDGTISKTAGSLWDIQGINLGGGSSAVVSASFGTINTGFFGSGTTISASISGTEGMRLTSTGLGIGTTTHTNKLSLLTTIDDTLPALGANGGKLGLFNPGSGYGMLFGLLGTGNGFIQTQRVDASAIAYNLLLNPNGGNVGIGVVPPTSILHTQSFATSITSKAFADTGYTASATDFTIVWNTSGGNSTCNLPTAVGISGRIYNIKHDAESTGGNTLTVDANGVETIDGALTQPIPLGSCITIQSTGTKWVII
jgi:hypothetical protein